MIVRMFWMMVAVLLSAATADAREVALKCDEYANLGSFEDDPDQLWSFVTGSFIDGCYAESLGGALRLKVLEQDRPMVRTYSYLLMNYKRLGQVKEAKGVIDEGRKVFGPLRHNTRMSSLKVNMASVRDTPALPQPSPIYPPSALASGTEGECDVSFDVDMDGGQPIDISAKCTDVVFVDAAISAVRAIKFAPKIIKGKAAPRKGVVYPILFRLDEQGQPDFGN